MAALDLLLDEMADKIRDAVAGSDWDFQVEPWLVLNPTTPCVDMWPGAPPTEDETAGFGDPVGAKVFTVRARVSSADTDAGRDQMLALMDVTRDESVIIALLDDPTLNGLASSIDLLTTSGLVPVPTLDGVGAYLGCLWTFLVVDVDS
jgi:hypothetical protein